MDYHKTVKILYDFFYYKIYRSGDLPLSERNIKIIDNFKRVLSVYYPIESIDVNFMIAYISWSFNYWRKSTKRRITLNWIIGKSTVKKYRERNTGSDYYVSQELFREYGVNIYDLHAKLQKIEDRDSFALDVSEENEKARFTGDARLYHCLETTTLYNHRSTHCISCTSREPCKIILGAKFPNLFKKRGYVECSN